MKNAQSDKVELGKCKAVGYRFWPAVLGAGMLIGIVLFLAPVDGELVEVSVYSSHYMYPHLCEGVSTPIASGVCLRRTLFRTGLPVPLLSLDRVNPINGFHVYYESTTVRRYELWVKTGEILHRPERFPLDHLGTVEFLLFSFEGQQYWGRYDRQTETVGDIRPASLFPSAREAWQYGSWLAYGEHR
jgi:hypothetical protein